MQRTIMQHKHINTVVTSMSEHQAQPIALSLRFTVGKTSLHPKRRFGDRICYFVFIRLPAFVTHFPLFMFISTSLLAP
jgi:hypothetical protein